MVSVGSPLDAHVDALVAQVRELSGEQRDFAKSVFFLYSKTIVTLISNPMPKKRRKRSDRMHYMAHGGPWKKKMPILNVPIWPAKNGPKSPF